MKYYMPAKIWEEKDCIAAHASEIAAMGRNALLVTGRRSAERNGSLKDVQKALEENGCKWVLFNEVEENPSVETIMKARDLGISEGVDLVITGEGCLERQTLMGKAPGHVINMARERCIPVIAICGAITPDISPSTIGLIAAIAVSDGLSIEQAMDTAGTLMRVGAAVRQAVTKVADSL